MPDTPLTLIVGASRGLGLQMTRELLGRQQRVIATIRSAEVPPALAALRNEFGDRLRIETLDTTDRAQLAALADRLRGETLDVLLVNAGVMTTEEPAEAASVDAFTSMMVTNALAPIIVARALVGLVRDGDGVVAFMSSRMGSVAANLKGQSELYRASKAALNSLARSFFVTLGDRKLTVVCLSPGWVVTDMGRPTPDVAVPIEASMAGLADVIAGEKGRHRHRFLHYDGAEVPW